MFLIWNWNPFDARDYVLSAYKNIKSYPDLLWLKSYNREMEGVMMFLVICLFTAWNAILPIGKYV